MLSESNWVDIRAITEIQFHDPGSLCLTNYSEFIKLRHLGCPPGKNGGVLFFFTKINLHPEVIRVPNLSEYDEILWLSVRPKVLPHPFNITAIAIFYYSPNRNIDSKCRFIQQLQTSADFVISKYVILINKYNFYSPSSALPPLGGSYHLLIVLSSSSNFENFFSTTYGAYHPIQKFYLLSFGMWLNTEDWSNIYSLKNLDEEMSTFCKKLINKY